ncbi:MAG: hypothetical protein DRO11_08610, partial [Methanobacteriota archaeon]
MLTEQSFEAPEDAINYVNNNTQQVYLKFNGTAPIREEELFIYSDDFEDGNLSPMIANLIDPEYTVELGNGGLNGNYNLEMYGSSVGGGESGQAIYNFNTLGYTNLSISYVRQATGFEAGDDVIITLVDHEVSPHVIYEDWETGDYSSTNNFWADSAWYNEGTVNVDTTGGVYNGTYHLRLRNDDALVDRGIDFSGVEGDVIVSFWAKADSFESGEEAYFRVENVSESGDYVTVHTWVDGDDNNTWMYHEFNLTALGFDLGENNLIIFESGMSGSSDYFYVDDIQVSFSATSSYTLESWSGNSVEITTDFNFPSEYDDKANLTLIFETDVNRENDLFEVDDLEITGFGNSYGQFDTDKFVLDIIDLAGVVNEVRGGGEFNVKDSLSDIEDKLDELLENQVETNMVYSSPTTYTLGEDAAVTLRLSYSEGHVTYSDSGADCSISINGPTNSSGIGPIVIDDQGMSELGAGTYFIMFNSSETGVYTVQSNCENDGRYYYSMSNVRIESSSKGYNTQIVPTHSTIYNTNEQAVISARLTYMDGGQQYLDTGASCYLTASGPTNASGLGPTLVSNQLMTELNNGIYYSVLNPAFTGVYTAQINCNNSGRQYFTLTTVRIERDLYEYLVSVIESKIDTIQSSLNNLSFDINVSDINVTVDNSAILNQLTLLQSNITQNYDELQIIEGKLDEFEGNFTQIINNQNDLLLMNNSINLIYGQVQNISTSVTVIESELEEDFKMIVHGTDYAPGDNGRVFLQLIRNATGYNDAICTVDIHTPDSSGGTPDYFVENALMLPLHIDGIYYYDFVVPNSTGIYMTNVDCFTGQNTTVNNAYADILNEGSVQSGTLSETYTDDEVYYELDEQINGPGNR